MEDILHLLKNYTREKHVNQLKENSAYGGLLDSKRLKRIYNEQWTNDEWVLHNDVPYESLTYLLDAYYCLPHRPDMGFAFLWMSINNTYKKVFLMKNIEKRLTDKICIDNVLTALEKKLYQSLTYKGQSYTILEIINLYVAKMPLKIYKFIANYLLRGYIIEDLGFHSRYNMSSYETFQGNFSKIHKKIKNTYSEGFKNICDPKITENFLEVNLQIDGTDEEKREKARTIPTSLAKKLRHLVKNRSVIIYDKKDNQDKKILETISIDNDYEYLNFIFRAIIYAIRNNSFHGSIASRLNSENADGSSVNASNYIFMLAHLFLSLFMYCADELKLEDLTVNLDNLPLIGGELK
ncbi:hypothetical protein COO04_09970 [Bacillus toyonensis]|uniref:hypothetical protein n=1 Tax=Bacillus cereus group TaxID=86661 RepID=UPI000BEB953B|nr:MULTISPECIES: hypothetical protein [Bacillus cereus group]MBJ7931856.1 hypothetical protein [Bacillus cereus group sp. N31]PEG16362.1 hypothetical protein COO04_09970 [Bacillus toyonensis]